MPRIFDNIAQALLPALRETLPLADRADFCVGYFNLRGWKQIDAYIERWSGGAGHCCRLLIGMQWLPQDDLREAFSLASTQNGIDKQAALRLKKKLAQDFREQLTIGAPTNQDEAGLQRLAAQIRAKKVLMKFFLRHPLHAKLYLLFRPDPISPTVGYLGSSNLTFAGLSQQGELNIDVVDDDACQKLARSFEDRWEERWCIDISQELLAIIEESWAREEALPPYYIYLKIAYHLSQEARTGVTECRIPRDFGNTLLEFQIAAVKIAAHHLTKRGGVLIGDVVGLGKTLMATAVARIFEDDPYDLETLILCPKNLVPMWEDYRSQYRMRARVLSISQVTQHLSQLRRYRLVLIDESHNLRNRDGRRYRAIQEYIRENESKVILLSATPYNKTYIDLSNQLRLFIADDADIGLRPERLLRDLGETEFIRRHQCSVRSLAAFEQSTYADDWRELMRLYMVRRTRSFIQDNYAQTDPDASLLDVRFNDSDRELCGPEEGRPLNWAPSADAVAGNDDDNGDHLQEIDQLRTEAEFRRRAAHIYETYAGPLKRRFRWLRADRFVPQRTTDLYADITTLLSVLRQCGAWDPQRDAKLAQLISLITHRHSGEKVLVFSQFADTVHYLAEQLQARGINRVGAATGDTDDPTKLAWHFSPVSNNKRLQVSPDNELDILIATDVLSEGQNLQDAAIVVNYDLPWAIIRLMQRAGRIDRIGQQTETIVCYSFLPADGVERIIRLRARVRQRLRENAEVVGSDEAFFDDDQNDQAVRDLFTEKAGILDGDADTEVDLSSYAFQIWKNAIDRAPSLQKTVAELPNVVYATKPHTPTAGEPPGVLVYVRTAAGNDALAWVDKGGHSITESQFAILKGAACGPETPALPRRDDHHNLVRRGVELIAAEEKSVGGQLGRPSGARFRTYERLMRYADVIKDTLFDSQQLRRAIEDIYSYPLRQAAVDILNRQLRSGISDEALTQLVIELREEDRLCIIHEEEEFQEPRIICSLGLRES